MGLSAIAITDHNTGEWIDKIKNVVVIGIGGSFRAISSALMLKQEYPLSKIHAFECWAKEYISFINLILKADDKELGKFGIKRSRFDVIKPGALILQRVFNKLSIQSTITSGVGVREGVYLHDLLRHSKDKFPHNYNTSVKHLIDSNIDDNSYSNQLSRVSKKLFDLTHKYLDLDIKYRHDLSIASKLYPTGGSIHFFSQNRHSYYLIKSALEYGFTHKQMILIATLVKYAKNKLPSKKHINKYITQANLFSFKHLRLSFSYILDTDIKLKTTNIKADYILEILIFRLCKN